MTAIGDDRDFLLSAPLAQLLALSRAARDARSPSPTLTYSRKVFIPLTQLCRDVCHYCTFAQSPRSVRSAFLTIDEVVEIAAAGAAMGCKEALFTLGDKPELRYRVAREALAAMGHSSTVSCLAAAAQTVLEETKLLPHLNPGVLDASELALLRGVSVSQGMMLESASERLCDPGGPHHGTLGEAKRATSARNCSM